MIALFGALTFLFFIANQLFAMWTFLPPGLGDPTLENQEFLFFILMWVCLGLTALSFVLHIYYNPP
jgi:hypothetical protein